ncbi:uncharacterized protein I303_104585 [Kwoniella dejecticola CBS 10117]|uniref:Uncharacterized protein n=1 Tax=Kwoniella dejecticola CBS 10117 TaxID=1296121 RepID=A0A1A6A4W8_9TREE|nr:uncharacterized protein I303_04438 [Kwoniella dejecticola CBS 10117]OBR85107.1 hypothetical protein I303_04438 [Kwoniella dejecticola CBS 10117]
MDGDPLEREASTSKLSLTHILARSFTGKRFIMGIFSHSAEDDVLVSATFPETNPFGLVVNGEQNSLFLHLVNQGKKNYTLVSASASYHDVNNHWATIKNASTLKYNVPIVAGSNLSAPFQVYSEYRPQEIGLTVWVNLLDSPADPSASLHQVTALNQTVSVVEPAHKWFDPSLLFLYLILSTALLGGAYAIYQSFFNTAPAKKGGKGAFQKKSVKSVVPAEDKSVYPNVKPYEEEWIPASHLKNRQSKLKKSKSGAGAASSGDELVTSGGEITSGGEASGTEGKVRSNKKKGKKA